MKVSVTKGDIITGAFIVLAAVIAVGLTVGLIGALTTQFSPKPLQYENSKWQSEDGAFVLTVGRYDSVTYECAATLTYTDPQGQTTVFNVCDEPYGGMGVYISESDIDNWQRISCSKKGFTARINRTAVLQYSADYEENEKVRFTRVS